MQILLLRHGDALNAGSGDDASRPLSRLGEEQARLQGRVLQLIAATPEIILASPLLRAQQTAEIVRKEIDCGRICTSEHLTPSADPRNIVRELNSLGREQILLVGHEPHLSIFISLLVTGSRIARIGMKKGSLACVEVDAPVSYGQGRIEWLLPASQSQAVLK